MVRKFIDTLNRQAVEHRTAQVLRLALLITAIGYVMLYGVTVLFRINYPFELEWVEGSTVDHIQHILRTGQLYVAPSIEYIPNIYTPLYFYVAALFTKVFGIGFFPARLVSFLSSLGCAALIFSIVRRETQDRFAGFVAACLFVATFRIGGAWFDVARVDSLFLFLTLAAFYVVRFHPSARAYIFAALLVTLAFLTKQSGLVACLPLVLYAFYVNRRHGFIFIFALIVLLVTSTLALNYLSDGWYGFYVFKLVRQHAIEKSSVIGFWVSDIRPLYIACVAGLFYLISQTAEADRRRLIFYSLMAAGMFGAAWSARAHTGGYDNVLLPAFAVIAVLFGLGLHAALSFASGSTSSFASGSAGGVRVPLLHTFIYLVCLMQFGTLIYNPRHQIPTTAELDDHRQLVETLKRIEGEVFIPYHGFLPHQAGKRSYAHFGAIADILRSGEEDAKQKLQDEMTKAFAEGKFSAVIMDEEKDAYLTEGEEWKKFKDLERYYVEQPQVNLGGEVSSPVTGMKLVRRKLYLPKSKVQNSTTDAAAVED